MVSHLCEVALVSISFKSSVSIDINE